MKKGIYLASHNAILNYDNIIYQDINGTRDIGGCMLDVDLKNYDFIIATPPCNYYSRANYRRETSLYSQKTKHLLPNIIDKLIDLGKPFIVENVRNFNLFKKLGLFKKGCFVYFHGRHTYWSNIMIDFTFIPQKNDNVQNIAQADRQGGDNVNNVINYWVEYIFANNLFEI